MSWTNKTIALLLALPLLAGADAVFARGGGSGGHGGFGHAASGAHIGVGVHAGSFGRPFAGRPFGGRPFVGVRPPVFVGRPPFRRGPVIIGGAVVVGAPFFYPYPYYYPPAYPAPAYAQPPAYVEQGVEQGAGPYYYCPDYGDYYPNVATCPSQWMEVTPGASPGASGYPN